MAAVGNKTVVLKLFCLPFLFHATNKIFCLLPLPSPEEMRSLILVLKK